jgi:hypothetical protein
LVKTLQIWLKSDYIVGHFTCRSTYMYADDSSVKITCISTAVKGIKFFISIAHSLVIYVASYIITIQRECIVAFSSQQWLHKCDTLLHYTCFTFLVICLSSCHSFLFTSDVMQNMTYCIGHLHILFT